MTVGIASRDPVSAGPQSIKAHWRFITFSALLGGVTFAAGSFLIPVRYTSAGAFAVETSAAMSSLPSGLAALASQLDLGFQGAALSPWFFADLATTDDMLRGLVQQTFPLRRPFKDVSHASFLELERVSGQDSLDRVEKGIRRLSHAISISLDVRSNIVAYSVTARDDLMARSLAAALFDSLNSFAIRQRQSSARNQREFVERRLQEARDQLSTSEQRLRDFYESNRSVETSPRLQLIEREIQRQIEVDQDVYLTLNREYEEAQIAEVRDIPVLTLVDRPDIPARKSSPRRRVLTLVGMLLFAVMGALFSLRDRLAELVTRGSLPPPD